MGDDTEFIKLPLLQRCTHKLWKARVHGYTEAAKVFQEEDEKSPVFGQYVGLVSKMVSDSNVVAQEKGLEATLYFVQNSSVAGKTVKDVMAGIVAKSIAAPKKSTQDLSLQIVLMYIEIEKQETVVEELVKGSEHKNPKIVAACVSALTTSLKAFGSQVVGVKPLFKPIQTLIEDRDKTVRDETKGLVVEIYRWIGEAIKPQLTKLKPIQLTELEAEFVKVKGEKAVPTRYLKSQQERQAKAAAEGGGSDGVDAVGAVVEEEIDPLSLIEAINIVAKIPNNFYEQLEAKKWQERKEALENLDKILDYPKFEKGDYGELVRALLKVINKDSNVVVVGVATKCVARLATGLKKNFHPYASGTLPSLLLKFKEKKANVVTPLREAVDAIFLSTTLEAIQEDVIASLDNKNPAIKAETAAFLGRCFAQCTPTVLNKKLLKPYTAALLKTLNEPDPGVRDSSAEALGVAMKVVSEKVMSPFLPDIDPLKLAKIKECCEKAVVKTVTVKAPPPEPAKVEAKPKKVLSGGAAKAQAAAAVKEKIPDPVESEFSEEVLDESTEKKKVAQRVDISPKITEELLANLADKNWKTRNDALIQIQGMLTGTKIKSTIGELPPLLLQRFVDTNSKLAVTALEVCTALATSMGPGSKNHVRTFAKGIFNALGDSKQWVRSAAVTCLNTWTAEAGAKEFFGGEIIPDILKTGSPTLKIEVWTWLGEVLPNERGLPKDELHLLIPILFAALEDRNADVRKVANGSVMGMMMHLGYQNMAKEVEKLKSASKPGVLQILDKVRPDVPEIELKQPAKPKADPKAKAAQPRQSTAPKARPSIKPAASRKKEEDIDTSPLLLVNKLKNQRVLDEQKMKILKWNFSSPRPEFVELLKDLMTTAGFNKNLMANMFHADFKFHLKAIDSLSDDLGNEEALVSNLDLILKWLTLRFFDTNPSVLLKGLEYLQSAFAILIDRDYTMFDVEANSFIPYLVMKIGDPKDTVRDRVRTILRQFSLMLAPGKLFVLIMDGLKSKNSRLRTECLEELGYLIEQFGTMVCMPSAPVALKEIAKQISDRDNSVRSAALNTIVKAHNVDGEKVLKQIGRLSDKDMSYLEERIKRSTQNRTKMHETMKVPQVEKKMSTTMIPPPEPEIDEEPEPPVVEEPPQLPTNPIYVYKKIEIPEPRVPKVELIEIDDKFLDEPVYIPESIREKLQKNPPPFPKLEEIVRNASSDNIQVAIEGSSKILALIHDGNCDKWERYSTMILDAIVKQLGYANSYNVATYGTDLGKLYKNLFRIIEQIFMSKTMIGQNASEGHLKSLLQMLILALVEEKTIHFKEDGYNKWLTLFIVKIIENSNPTNATCAVISNLHELVEKPPSNPKYVDIATKLVLKMVVIYRKADDFPSFVNLDKILYTCHLFLQAFPRHSWKDRSSDVPIKCMRTLLVNLVTLRGPEILMHMRNIENSISSELAMYLKKIIMQQTNDSKQKLPKPLTDHLSEIFKKIANESSGNEGLVELYEFQKKHPDVDISGILEPTSEFFKSYVRDGLKQIEKERGPLRKVREVTASPKVELSMPIPSPNPPENDALLPQYYLDRLKLYQQKLGMPLTNIPDFDNRS